MEGIRRFMRESVGYGTLFLVLVTVFSTILYKWSGDRSQYFDEYEVAGVRAKKEVFAAHKEEYNTVFIGSSRTYNQIDPSIFDGIIGTQSFNLAYSAVQPFRIFDYVAAVAEMKPDLAYVFVELSPLSRLYDGFKESQHLHALDEERYQTALDVFGKNNLPLRLHAESVKDYTKLLAYKYIGFNSAKRWRAVLDIYEPQEQFVDRQPYLTAGFFPTDSVKNDKSPMRQRQRYFQEHPETMKRYDHSTQRDDFSKERDQLVDEWKNLQSLFSEDTKIILLIPPRNPENSIVQTAKLKYFLEQEGMTIFDFSDSDDYPVLFQVDNSNDEVHLNLKGAQIYTRLIAEKVQTLNSDID
ncbi:MAG: hypothetical protein AAGI23_16275 [Bacteroidota bacterium]